MCKPIAYELSPGHIDIVCEYTGKPITSSDMYGMWCPDLCDREKAVALIVKNPDGSMNHMETMRNIFHQVVEEQSPTIKGRS